MSYDLARIRTDIKVKLDLEHARADDLDFDSIEALFTELEFRSLIKTLGKLSGKETTPAPSTQQAGQQLSMFASESQGPRLVNVESNIQVHIVDTPEKLAELVQALNQAKVISFDTETTSTEEMRANIVGISLAIQEGEGYYIPVGHMAGTNLPIQDVIAALQAPMTDPQIGKIAHNAKYDYIVLARNGLYVTPLTFDTMLAEFIVDPGSRNLGLKNMAFVKLGEEMTHIEELIGKGKKQITNPKLPAGRSEKKNDHHQSRQ